MKVVLFCGGKGIRLRRGGSTLPKPLVRIGTRPILWNVMKYYAHYGHTDFILCLGHRANLIKRFFLHYDECVSNDFTLSQGGDRVEVFREDIRDWKITFIDTGLSATIGQRLYAVRDLLKDEDAFLANYADGLTDLHLPTMIEAADKADVTASFLSVRPQQSFHVVRMGPDNMVTSIDPMASADLWINGGYFYFKRGILDHLGPGDELVEKPFAKLIAQRKLLAHRYDGFWASMDTFKDKQMLETMYAEGRAVWQVWT